MSKEEILDKHLKLHDHFVTISNTSRSLTLDAMQEFSDQSTSHLQAKLRELERENGRLKKSISLLQMELDYDSDEDNRDGSLV